MTAAAPGTLTSDLFRLDGRKALVTGGATGIGRAHGAGGRAADAQAGRRQDRERRFGAELRGRARNPGLRVRQTRDRRPDPGARQRVNVNAIAPGYTATDNTRALRDDPVRSKELLSRIPAGRFADPSEMAGAAVFPASDAASCCHGTVVAVDGGWLAR
jgi:NAD(P)-dependent dehydrogenase (short-subunit alcohol dehydrogenase family)